MVGVFVVWLLARNSQNKLFRDEVHTSGRLISKDFFSVVEDDIQALENLRVRMEMTNGDYYDYWEEDARLILSQNPSFKFVEWIDSTMVIRKITPLVGNEEAINLDISKIEYRKEEWLRHAATSTTNITQWTSLTQGGKAFLVDVPVYFNNTFQGTITAGMDFTSHFNNLAQSLENKFAISIIDERGNEFYKLNEPSTNKSARNVIYSTTFLADATDGQRWQLLFRPSDTYVNNSRQSIIGILLFGGLLAAITSFMVYFYLNSKNQENNLKKVNAKLTELNESLTKERIKAYNASIAKTEFISNMSHEIRTPLNAMLGFVELLKEVKMEESAKKYLSLLNISSKKLLLLVDDILEIDKIESGQVTFRNEEFSPRKELYKLVELYRPSTNEKGLQLTLLNKTNSNFTVSADLGKYSQVITNLLKNAIKFTDRGRIVIEYSEKQQHEKLNLCITITDTGLGIPKNKLASIFDRFTQLDASKTKRHEGSGLGLYITNQLVKYLGGVISVDSKEGEGTQFTIELSFSLAEEIERLAINTLQQKQLNELKVLLVDDNKMNLIVLQKTLERFKVKADTALNGNEAVAMAFKNYYDIIFMDVHMPQMDGFEATQRIRKNNNEILIVGVSANVTKEAIDESIEVGMDDYLTKPISFNKLEDKLVYYQSLINQQTT
jgi:signal transduction histidine kinase/ActR/RegA family two-component response regulator